MAPDPFVLSQGDELNSVCVPSGPDPSLLSNSWWLALVGIPANSHPLGNRLKKKMSWHQETKQCDVMEKSRLSAGLQSFLAWHNLCLVMTVYSLLTLTESLARINCVHDFSPCVLTLRNRRKLQHLLWSNSIFSSGSRWSVHASDPLHCIIKISVGPAGLSDKCDSHKSVPACQQLERNEFQLFTRNNGLSSASGRTIAHHIFLPKVHFLIFLTTAYWQCTSTDESQMWWPPSNYSANDRLRCMALAAAGVIVLLSRRPASSFFSYVRYWLNRSLLAGMALNC